MPDPETQLSLMLRLREPNDQQAWARFVAIYEPLVFRLVRRRGLQEADAQDVTQQVILAVMNAVENWSPDGADRSFRRWLFTIARKLTLRFLQRQFQSGNLGRCGVGGTDMVLLLNNLPEPDHRTIEVFDEEYRDCVFKWAADRIRTEFRDSVWNAFWKTFVLNEPVSDVAHELGMTSGYVYVARSRVMSRLKQLIQEFEDETNEGP